MADVLGDQIEDWFGKAWADYFAKCGAATHMVADALSESARRALQVHERTLQYVAWARLNVVVAQAWGLGAPPVQATSRVSASRRCVAR